MTEPWCSNCNDEHSIDESCSDNAKRYEDAENDRAGLIRRIHSATPYLRAILNAPSATPDVRRWAALAERALVAATDVTGGSTPNPTEATATNAPSSSLENDG